MQMIITLQNKQVGAEINSVNARELHSFIQAKQEFANWIKNRIKKYDFLENKDYIIVQTKKAGNNATLKEYYITLDMAKELSMVENNDKGREARRWFIDVAKKYQNTPQVDCNAPYTYQLERENIELRRAMNRLLLTGSDDEELFQLKVKHRVTFPTIIEFFKRVERKAKLQDAERYLVDIKNLLEKEAKKINSHIMLGDMTMIPSKMLERDEVEHFKQLRFT